MRFPRFYRDLLTLVPSFPITIKAVYGLLSGTDLFGAALNFYVENPILASALQMFNLVGPVGPGGGAALAELVSAQVQ